MAQDDEALPVLLRMTPRTEAPDLPEPLARHWETFMVAGRPIRYVGEKWRAQDIPRLPWPGYVDGSDPETGYSIRFVDLATGEIIPPADDDEVLASLAVLRRRAPPSRGSKLR